MSNKNKHILVVVIAFIPLGIFTTFSSISRDLSFLEIFEYSAFITLIFGFFLYVFTLITFQMFFNLKIGYRANHPEEFEDD
jgi:Na+/serine symporter